MGEHILKPFQDPCTTCDERQTKQRPHVLQAASRAVKRQLRALRLKKEKKEKKREKKEKKERKRRAKKVPLCTEDEADDEEESEDPGHCPLGYGDGGGHPGAPGAAPAVC